MKPFGVEVFDANWKRRCKVLQVSVSKVDSLIKKHYLQKRPAVVTLAVAMFEFDEMVGCVVYSMPPRETEKRYGKKTWELARLYLIDRMPQNAETWLISKSIKWIKTHYPEVCNLVSYADPSAGHSGTIYRASNWLFDGMTDAGRKTPRCDYFDARTGKKYGRKGNMPKDAIVERRPRISKLRFFFCIKK
jgi:hypothetical protein